MFDVTIADNILVKPGSGTYFDVQENISGVRTPGNIRLRSPDTARPTIGKLSPAPRSKIRDRTPTIRATVKDNATNLSKRNIKLYVAGSAVPASEFAYNRSRNLLTYTPPRLSYGEKTVRIVATDTTGNTASKTWRFNVVRR